MEVNHKLHDIIIEVVENQLAENNPKIVSTVYNSLLLSGKTELKAKEEIARVLMEEMYPALKYKKSFDNKTYENKLKKLIK